MIFHVFRMFHSENIAIFAILLRYFDILVIGFVILFGYCISVFERYCTSAVNTYILPSPKHARGILRHSHNAIFDQNSRKVCWKSCYMVCLGILKWCIVGHFTSSCIVDTLWLDVDWELSLLISPDMGTGAGTAWAAEDSGTCNVVWLSKLSSKPICQVVAEKYQYM